MNTKESSRHEFMALIKIFKNQTMSNYFSSNEKKRRRRSLRLKEKEVIVEEEA